MATQQVNDPTVDDIVNSQGVIDTQAIFNLEMPDDEIVVQLNRRIDDSLSYWNNPTTHNLKDARETSMALWLGRQKKTIRNSSRYVDPIIDNRVFASIESIISHVTSRPPQAEVQPAQDTERSRLLARDVEKVSLAHAKKSYLTEKLKASVRNLMIKRVGILHLRWDPNAGRNGEIVVEAVNPDHVVFDKNTPQGENPGFISRTYKAPLDKLLSKFPDAKEKIFKELGIVKGTPLQMAQVVAYREVFFTSYRDGKPEECVAWYFGKCCLGKMKDPNWLPEEGGKRRNFLDAPMKPYILINYINDGNHLIDNISAIELTKTLQEGVNKRNIQIAENVEHANGQRVFAAGALSTDQAQRLTGSPNQKIIVNTKDVRAAVTNLQGQMLPQYVFQDKYDLRNEIDNILGTPSQFRGGEDQSATLGQDVMIRNQAFSRQDDIIRAIDIAMDKYFKLFVQFMKVYYTEDHYYTINAEDGRYDYIAMSNNIIEEGIDINVQTGSTLAIDKERQEAVSLKLASMKLIDPLSLYEDLRMPNAQKRFERLVKYNVDPTLLTQDLKKEDADRDAYMDYVVIMDGKKTKPREEVTEEHLKSHNEQMMTAEFRNAKPQIQQALIDHVTLEHENLRKRLMLESTQLPDAAEMQQPPVPGMPVDPSQSPLGAQAPDPSNIASLLAQRMAATQTADASTPPGTPQKAQAGSPAIPGQSPNVV